jgi:hypothetical protein
MLKDARDAKDVAEAARLLRQARTNLIYVHSNQTAAHGRIGDRERRIQETLQRVTKRISSAYRELEKLAPRRSDRSLLNFPHEPPPQKVKWGGGPPPQWVHEAAERERAAYGEPSEPPEPPPMSLIWLDDAIVACLSAMREPGESDSDVILRLADQATARRS